MLELHCGERAVRCLRGEPVDRVPFGIWFGWEPWGDVVERWQRESGIPTLDYAKYFRYERAFALPDIHPGIFPEFDAAILGEDEDFVVSRNERGITMRNRRDGLSMPEFLAYPVTSPDDWERLKAERLNPATPGRIHEDWDGFRARLRETGEAVQVGWYPYGVFGTCRDLLGVEELLVGFYTAPEMIRDMMSHLTTLWIALWEQVAAEVPIDHLHIWEDMSGRQGSLISPAMIAEFMMPCYDRITDFAHAHGIRIQSVDSDGDCHELVPLMMAHGINTFLPFEVQAGNDIRLYRRQYPELGIIGGLDKRCLAGTHADVDAEIDKAAEMMRHGRYIPSFDHLIPPDARWENMCRAAFGIRQLCHDFASAS